MEMEEALHRQAIAAAKHRSADYTRAAAVYPRWSELDWVLDVILGARAPIPQRGIKIATAFDDEEIERLTGELIADGLVEMDEGNYRAVGAVYDKDYQPYDSRLRNGTTKVSGDDSVLPWEQGVPSGVRGYQE